MRKFIAALILLCFGITIPSAAMAWRVCLSDEALMGSGISMMADAESGQAMSCSDCCEEDKSCCAELKKLPDSTLRSGNFVLPVLVVMDLPPVALRAPQILLSEDRCHLASAPIRGPDPPSRLRALLAVWII